MAVFVSSTIFVVALILILSEKVDRAIVALAGAALMIAAGMGLGFYNEHLAIEAIDFETLGLLFGMMVMVALLRPTGFFEYLAARTARLSRGRPALLLVLLGAVTTVLSMFLDNVTTVVLIAPVTVLITEILGISPMPFLLSEALLSNTGGVSTLIGDPPNVLIGSAADLSFNDFLVHSLPVVAVAWVAALLLILLLFRKELSGGVVDPGVLDRLNPREALHDPVAAMKIGLVLGLTVVLFFLQDLLGASSSLIAMSMAALALVWLRPNLEKVLERLEWTVLVFFGGLFVIVGGLEQAGALQVVEDILLRVTVHGGQATAITTLWLAAVGSAIVDNIPITVAMIPVIEQLGQDGVEIFPLWWALAFGAGFGGNGTIIGSTANVIVCQVSTRTREPITSRVWLKRGLPVMLLTCMIGSLAFLLAWRLFLP